MSKINIIDHSLVKHSLTVLRNKKTKTEMFRRHTATVSQILIVEVLKNIATNETTVETPLNIAKGHKVQEKIVVVPVLRAGLSMLFPARDFLPWASVGFIGLERDENTAIAREYYKNLPKKLKNKYVLILDPMLATGGSLVDTITAVKQKHPKRISSVCIVGAPEGIERMKNEHPDVDLYIAAIDSHLDENKFIVPGLGDFGDRYFGT
ncbi:uracil phosphoribosyltransferase [Candidatus Neomarinimicrobiota bacterium]